MRVMMIAGEASGDLHGSAVIREIMKREPESVIFGIGGDKMRSAGMELVYHIKEISVMGFWEVLQHLPLLRSVEQTMKVLLKLKKPDILLLIDYPGFNLRFARVAHEAGVKVAYYISPQVWAWRPGRVKKMKQIIDKMLVVFPFELDIYRKEGIDAEFVGHPLLEAFTQAQGREEFCTRYGFDGKKPIIGLFPGSRTQELERIFPAMLGAARILKQKLGAQIAVGVSSILDYEFVKSFIRDEGGISLIQHATYDVMKNSDLSIVTSGTATLETAYYGTPMIVVYKTSWLTYLIGRMFIRIKNISLVNIVAGETIVPEIIQSKVNPENLANEAQKLLGDPPALSVMRKKMSVIGERLGSKGASSRVAGAILSMKLR